MFKNTFIIIMMLIMFLVLLLLLLILWLATTKENNINGKKSCCKIYYIALDAVLGCFGRGLTGNPVTLFRLCYALLFERDTKDGQTHRQTTVGHTYRDWHKIVLVRTFYSALMVLQSFFLSFCYRLVFGEHETGWLAGFGRIKSENVLKAIY